MATAKARNYTELAPTLATALTFQGITKTASAPGKPAMPAIYTQNTGNTFQLWAPSDGASYPQMPFGISEPISLNDPRKKTLEFAIENARQQAFVRAIDEINLQYLEENAQALWSRNMSREEIEQTFYQRALRNDPASGQAKRSDDGREYAPTVRTHFYIGAQPINNENKKMGCSAGILISADRSIVNMTYNQVNPFDYAVPVVRYIGMFFTQGKWFPSFTTESMIVIPNMRQVTQVPNVDLASLALPEGAFETPGENGDNMSANEYATENMIMGSYATPVATPGGGA